MQKSMSLPAMRGGAGSGGRTLTPFESARGSSVKTSSVKKSSVKPTLGQINVSMEDLHRMVQEKLLSKIGSGDEIRCSFAIFGRSSNGISPQVFRDSLANLGIVLSPKDAQNLFARYDEDGSGRIDIYELMRNILPRDYSAKTWVEKSEQKRRSFNTKRKQARRERGTKLFQSIQYPRALRSSMGLSTEAVLQLVRDKINGKARAATDVLRQAFFLFDRKTSLSPEEFQACLHNYAIPCNRDHLDSIFAIYDPQKSGRIDFHKFVRQLFKAGSGKTWYQVRGEETYSRFRNRHRLQDRESLKNLHDTHSYAPSLQNNRMSTQDIIQVIRQKFDQKARASTDLYRQAYNLFGRPEHGVTKDHFRRTMHRMGVPVSRNDVN